MGKKFRVHVAIWEMHNGPIPNGLMIDHIDGNPFNSRLNNLRLANHSQNQSNIPKKRHNTSGFKGVYWRAERGAWRAEIRARKKKYMLGTFKTPEEAHAAYVTASHKLHGEYARI